MVIALKLLLLGAACLWVSLMPVYSEPPAADQQFSYLLAFHRHFHSSCIQVYDYTNLLYEKKLLSLDKEMYDSL